MDHDKSGIKFYSNIVRPVLSLLSPEQKKRSRWLITLVVIGAVIDFFGVAAFLPLLILIVKPESTSGNSIVHKLYVQVGFSTPAQFIIFFAIALLLLVVLKNFISRWIAKKKAAYAFGISDNLASIALVRYLEMSYLSFSQADFTRELNRIVNYPFAFANNIILPLTALASEFFVSLLILTGITIYDWRVAAMLLLLVIPVVILYQARRKKLKTISSSLKEKYPLFMKYALQVIEGFSEIKSTQTEDFFHQRFRLLSKDLSDVFAKDQVIQSGTVRMTEVVVTLLLCALIAYSVSFQQDYQNTLLLLGIYAAAAFRMIPSISRILHSSQQIRLHEYLLEELMPLRFQRNDRFTLNTESQSFNDSIELRNISFGYPEKERILKNVSLNIRKGEKVALTGESGGGKTTLLLILLRFLKESEGQILIDGDRITNDHVWRKLLGYVSQSPYILDSSIAENVAFGVPRQQIDRPRIEKLIRDLGLEEVVSQLPEGIDSQIGERGIKLSGGQRQRIAIARVLYADAEVLLLDEITNQVHTFMEKEILTILNTLASKQKTIIMVTHHINDAAFFDSIYTLDDGVLKEMELQPDV